MARVKAPFSGVIESIMLKEGELAAPGMQLIQLVNPYRLKLYGNISERYMSSVRKGDEVIVSFPDVEDLSFKVPIYRVGSVIDDKSRTFRIEMKIDNADGKLKPNMYTTIKFSDFSSETAMLVPAIVIKQDIQGKYLYVADRNGGQPLARKKYITTGLSYNELTVITAGLDLGDEVIIKGYSQVSDGAGIVMR
jgi:RND family efflux transporter MFP subunit